MPGLDAAAVSALLWRDVDRLRRHGRPLPRTIDLRERIRADASTDERRALFDAIKSAPASGGARILLPSGNIRICGDAAADPAGLGRRYLTIDGVRDVQLVGLPGTRLVVDGPDVSYALLLQNAERVRLERIQFGYLRQPDRRDDSGPKCLRITGARDLQLVDIEVSGSPEYGIGIEGSERVLALRCFVHDTMADGINANGCNHSWMLLNRTQRTGDDGLAVVSPEGAGAGARGERSIIALNAVEASDSRGIFAMGDDVIVASNTVDLTSGAAIGAMRDLTAHDPGMPASGLLIIGNFLRHAATLRASNADGPNGHRRRLHGTSSGIGAIQVSEAGRNLPPLAQAPRAYHRDVFVLENVIRDAGWAPVMLHAVIGACVAANEVDGPNVRDEREFRAAVWLRYSRDVQVGGNVVRDDSRLDHDVAAERSEWRRVQRDPTSMKVPDSCEDIVGSRFQAALDDLARHAGG